MNKTLTAKTPTRIREYMRQEYDFDYRKQPNRFADKQEEDRVIVMLDPDVSEVFQTPDSVNRVLRALIEAMPPKPKRKKASV